MYIIGIDPGITGAIAVLDTESEFLAFEDMPVTARTSGKGNKLNPDGLFDFLSTYHDYSAKVFIEHVNAMPPIKGKQRQMGTVSAFNFGEGFGIIQGVVAGLELQRFFVPPVVWKRYHRIVGKDKDAARTRALELFPQVSTALARKKDVGRADAILIAAYGKYITNHGDIFK